MNRRTVRGLVFVALVVAATATTVHFEGRERLAETGGRSPLRLGMDLQGGVMLVMEVQEPATGPLTPQVVEDARLAMERRIDQLGIVEPVVESLKGDNWRRIIVSLPGVTDLESALNVVGRQGSLSFKLNGVTVLSGGDLLAEANAGFSSRTREPAVHIVLKPAHAREFARITREHVGEMIEIYLDDEPVVGGVIQTEIPDGRGEISGGDIDLKKAAEISAILRGGVLPAPVEHKETRFVDPTLGAEISRKSLIAGVIGIAAVFAYMVAFYRMPGVLACLALSLYIGIVAAVFMSLGATLSLAGIAGFILSIGMAVDANIIIFERIKEELRSGKRVRSAVEAGFTRAWSAILDGNATTLIAAAILFYFGSTRVQGFALTLSIGILTSMFTAIVITRILLRAVTDPRTSLGPRFFGALGGERK